MITNETKSETIRYGDQKASTFAIKASAKAFSILSDKLYSDKPRAIVRELSTNAWDAHKAANNTDQPFTLHLPNTFEPFLEIRDFGIGLDHEDVIGLYSTYFESTKNQSNDFVGALGLGSKSPFAYVDQFTVTSFFNGKKRIYAASLDAGVPQIAQLGETMDTTEHNGLLINVPVKKEDFNNFIEAAKKTLAYFPVTPKMTGAAITITKPEYKEKGTGWGLRTGMDDPYGHRRGGSNAIQGFIAYPLDYSAWSDKLEEKYRVLIDMGIDVYFEIGELDIVPSREALSYDATTIANIKAKLDTVFAHFGPHFQNELDKCKTYWEAKIRYREIFSGNHGYALKRLAQIGAFNLNYKGRTVDENYFEITAEEYRIYKNETVFDPVAQKNTTVKKVDVDFEMFQFRYSGANYRMSRQDTSYKGTWSIQPYSDSMFIYDDVGRGVQARIISKIEDMRTNGKRQDVDHIYILRGNKAMFDKMIKELGDPNFSLASDFDKPAVVKGARAAGPAYYEFDPNKYYGDKNGWGAGTDTTMDVDTSAGVYVIVERFTVRKDGNEWYGFKNLADMAQTLGWFKTTKLIGFTPRYTDRAKANTNLVHFSDWIADQTKKTLSAQANLTDVIDAINLRELNSSGNASRFLRNTSLVNIFLKEIDKNSDFAKYITKYQATAKLNIKDVNVLGKLIMEFDPAAKANGYDFEGEWNKLSTKYPLTQVIDFYNIGETGTRAFAEYVNLKG